MEQSRILLVFTNSHIALFWIPKIGLISLFLLSDNSRTVGYVFGKSRRLCMVCLFWKYCAVLEWKKSVLEIFCRIRTEKNPATFHLHGPAQFFIFFASQFECQQIYVWSIPKMSYITHSLKLYALCLQPLQHMLRLFKCSYLLHCEFKIGSRCI